jgi:hypothetical protein
MQIFSLQAGNFPDKRFNDCLIVFLGLEVPNAATIDDAYLRWSESHVMPPTTLIVARRDLLAAFKQETSAIDGRISGLDRLYRHGGPQSVVLCGFDFRGDVFVVAANDGPSADVSGVIEKAIESFIKNQIEQLDVVIPAPLGTFFEKLSGRFASHFIRTEALLQSTSAIELLALRLLRPFTRWCDSYPVTGADSPTIYIDTMSVWPVAEKLCQMHQISNSDAPKYRIESFKSYDGLAEWNPPERRAFVLISASTSGGLAHKVRGKFSRAQAEVWTILSLAEEESDEGSGKTVDCILSIPRQLIGRPALDGLRSFFQPDILELPPGTETINIVGERFLSQPARPKRVRLVHTTLEESAKRTLARIAQQKIAKAARGRFDARGRWSLSFDLPALLNLASMPAAKGAEPLLKRWLRNYSSPSPIAIVYPSPAGPSAVPVLNAALAMAAQTADILQELMPGARVFQISSNDLAVSSREFPHKLDQCSVIIVAPVIGNGFIFKQISALLRHKQPTGPRLFLALAALPESAQHFAQLKSDIGAVSTDDRHYEFKCQFALPVGRLDRAVQWDEELDVLLDLVELMNERKVTEPSINARLSKLERLEVMDDKSVFLPTASGSPLLLSTGFFLWEGNANIEGEDLGAAVLLTIASLLQGARTAASKADATSLRTGLFQHALICPETFTRFNDAVIQAAILRAAYPAELNYSVSEEMSHDMERLLIKWLQYSEHPVGGAAGEFLMAIAIGKLKLRKEHLAKVLAQAKLLNGWLGCLATLAAARASQSA